MNEVATTATITRAAQEASVGTFWERRPHVALPLLAVLVFAAAFACLVFSRLTSQLLVIWLANAIALNALLRSSRRRWPGYVGVTFAGLFAASLLAGNTPLVASAVGVSHLAEILIAAVVLSSRRAWTVRYVSRSLRWLAILAATAAVAAACSAALAATLLPQDRVSTLGSAWIGWFVADAVGLVVLTPFLLSLSERRWWEIEEQVRLLAHALRGANDCISITDIDDHILYVNDAFIRTYGYQEHELIGQHIGIVQDASVPLHEIRQFTKQGGWRGVLWNTSKTGQTFPVSLATSLVRDEAGRTIAAVGVARDVTREQAVETALRESEQKFAKLFRASPDCIVVSEAGPGGVLEVNDRFEMMSGRSRNEIIGRTITDLGGLVDTTTRDRWVEELRRSGSIRNWEYQVRRPNGDISTFVMSAESLELGGRPCFVSVHRDITDRLRAREAVHQNAAKYRDLVENANDVIFMIDRDGLCLWMNRAGREITGAVAGAGGTHLTALVAPDQAEMVERQLRLVLDGGTVPTFEMDIINAHGRRVALELDAHPVSEGGVIVGAQGIARDVTERKELETQLRHAQKMQAIGSLAGGIAHDFNNLLTAILGYSDLAMDHLDADSSARGDIEEIGRVARSAQSLTRQLLVFGRKGATLPTVLDLNDVVGRLDQMLRRVIGEQITMNVRLGEQAGHIKADPHQIEQVIMNLVVNGRDAMPAGGSLTIATDFVELGDAFVRVHPGLAAGPYVRLIVSDTGTGMTPEVQSHLFTPFFTTKAPGKGTGLGLATVHGIVHQAEGCIAVESAPGQGATFTVYLPRVAAPPEPIAVDAQTIGAPPPLAEPETILFVEDEASVRSLGVRVLRQYGYHVLEAGSAEEAIEVANRFSGTIDLLLTDLVMPGADGRALAGHLRKSRENMKIMFASGYADDQIADEMHAAGVTLIQKPYWPEAMAQAVRRVLHGD